MNGVTALQRHLCILDVGQGNCAVVIAEATEVVVIDVGRRSALLEFLNQRGIDKIKTVYLSHADEDHIGALVGLLAAGTVNVGRVMINSDSTKATRVWDDLVYELNSAHRAGTLDFKVGMVSGDGDDLSGVEVRVLAPSHYLAGKGVGSVDRSGRKITSNSISAVIRVSVSGKHVAILPGDIDGIGLDDLLAEGADLNAPVVVYPHHGGRPGVAAVRPFVEKLLGAISPEVIVFSFGRRSYGAPNPETVRVLREVAPGARIVCTQLSEHCSGTVPAESPTHLNDAFALGRADRTCCGGTVVIPLDRLVDLEPRHASHTGFIHSNVETPLCLPDGGPEQEAR